MLPKVKMTGTNIAIRPDEIETERESGLIVQTQRKELPTEGIVLAVGPGLITLMGERVPLTVEVGDRVTFEPLRCSRIGLGGDEIYILDEEDVLAILLEGEDDG